MSFLKVAGKDGAAPSDTRCVDAAKDLLARCESGEVMEFTVFWDGPQGQDFIFAGDIDLDRHVGYSQRVFAAVARGFEK